MAQCSDGVVVFDAANGAVIDFNDQAATRLAFSRDEFAGFTATDLLVGEDADPGEVLLTAAAAAGNQGLDLRQRSKDGTMRDVRVRATFFSEARDSFYLVTIQDLTESKRRECERARELHRLARQHRIRERLNDAIVHAPDLERMLELALDVVLEEVGWDRVLLMRIPEADADSFAFFVQRTRPEFPGPGALGIRVPLTPAMRESLAALEAGQDIIECDAERVCQLTAPEILARVPIKAIVMIAVRPRIGGPWCLGLSAARGRVFAEEEKEVVKGLVPRLEDALTARLAQDELRHSLQTLELAQERARIGSWELDVAKWCGEWSSEMFVLCYRDRMLGMPTPVEVLDLVHPEDRSYVEAAINAFISSGDERCILESRTHPALGPLRILRSVIDREMRGGRLFLAGTSQDVTEQRQAAALAARLDDLLKQFDVGVFSYTTAGDLLEMNDALVRLLDCSSASEAIQQGYQQVLFGRSPLPPAGPPSDPGREREVRVTTALGHERLLWVSTRPLAIAGKIYRIDGLVRDVTAERLTERRGRASAVAAAKVDMLTSREREVLDRVVVGEANKVIARGLGLSEKTVEKHRASLMRKTGAKSVAELVRLALLAQKVSGG